ncbi:efflux transporter outer membrane subunit [Novosphingobium sp. ERN07]|uniref:efflux transporter outer membrane subunit n=1 Tax=Novosphingobium sp. ERN07 TaxID=2726187 RepID=UPI001F10D793|nr:efflux transporter outer membrane subunit [Novosphingobium sp. ERN07]
MSRDQGCPPFVEVIAQTRIVVARQGGGSDFKLTHYLGDARLQRLISLSMRENRDLRIVALNAEAALAQTRIQRAQGRPNVNVDMSYTRQRQPAGVAGAGVGLGEGEATGFSFDQFSAQSALTAFEIDLFGRIKAQNDAANERYFASREGQRAVRLTVIGAVVEAYLAERLAAEQVALIEATLADWQASLALTQRLHAAGQASGIDLAQIEGLMRQAQADLAQRERERMQATNALVLAVGTPLPDDLPDPVELLQQPIRTSLAPGTPSDLLLRRPDIAQAEHELRAANADIGAARAAFLPRLSLTAAFGFASLALEKLFQPGNRSWSYSPSLTAPIFRGGELRGSLDLARVRKAAAVATYERTIQTAFREVADGLDARATFTSQTKAQQDVVDQAENRARLVKLAYQSGLSARLELLDAQRTAYAARQALLVVRRDELSSASALYRALGGAVD